MPKPLAGGGAACPALQRLGVQGFSEKTGIPSGTGTQGHCVDVHTPTLGANLPGSSSVPAFTITMPLLSDNSEKIGDPQVPQKRR
jgi:hypothetical protein